MMEVSGIRASLKLVEQIANRILVNTTGVQRTAVRIVRRKPAVVEFPQAAINGQRLDLKYVDSGAATLTRIERPNERRPFPNRTSRGTHEMGAERYPLTR